MVSAAEAFLATLNTEQRDAVSFDWTDTAQKQRWSNLPSGSFDRAGLMWGDLDRAQQSSWLALMRASLSSEGYDRVLAVWRADDAFVAAGGNRGNYGTQYFSVALIGTPSNDGPWMWQFGGHHLAVNATMAGGRVSVTPGFLGSRPTSYRDADGRTVRPLGDVEDAARDLVNSLDAAQRQAAVLGSAPIDLRLGAGQDGRTIVPEGLPVGQMTPEQQATALRLVGYYTGLVNDADAAARLDEIRAGLGETYFAWYGPTSAGDPFYFCLIGPTIVIEYAPQGSGLSGLVGRSSSDHVHSVYRDPTNEYGGRYAR